MSTTRFTPERYREACERLGVSDNATGKDIRTAYLDLAKVWHPDRFLNDARLRTKAEEQFKAINTAYDYICAHLHTRQSHQSPPSQPHQEPAKPQTSSPPPPQTPPRPRASQTPPPPRESGSASSGASRPPSASKADPAHSNSARPSPTVMPRTVPWKPNWLVIWAIALVAAFILLWRLSGVRSPTTEPHTTQAVPPPAAPVITSPEVGPIEEIELVLSGEASPRFGLFSWNSRACLSLDDSSIKPGTLAYLATFGPRPQILASTIQQQVSEQCRDGLPPEYSSYLLNAASWNRASLDGEVIGLVGLSMPPRVVATAPGTGRDLPIDTVKLRYCYSSEGMHFTAWRGGTRIWHVYNYLSYDTPASCVPSDY